MDMATLSDWEKFFPRLPFSPGAMPAGVPAGRGVRADFTAALSQKTGTDILHAWLEKKLKRTIIM